MAIFTQSISAADVLAGLTTDSTKWAGANIARIISTAPLGCLDFWGEFTGTVTVSTTAADKTLNDVTLPNLSGATIKAAYALMRIWRIKNTYAGVNAVSGTQYIQVDKAAAGYINAIKLVVNSLSADTSSSVWNAGFILGSIDIQSRVDWNSTTNFKWALADANQNDLEFYGIQMGIRVII
jgi:hypothetical protein